MDENDCCEEPEIGTGAGGPGAPAPADGCVEIENCVDPETGEPVPLVVELSNPQPQIDIEYVCGPNNTWEMVTFVDGVETSRVDTGVSCELPPPVDVEPIQECREGTIWNVWYAANPTTGEITEVQAADTGQPCAEECAPGEAWCRRIDRVWVDNQVIPDRPHGGALYPQDNWIIDWVLSDGTTGSFSHPATGGGTWGANNAQLGDLLTTATGITYVGANHGFGDDDDMTTPFFGAAIAEICPGDRYVVKATATTVGGTRDGRVIELAVGVIPGEVETFYRCGCCGETPTWFTADGAATEAPSGCLNRSCNFPGYPPRPASSCLGTVEGPFCHVDPADPDNPTTDDIVASGIFVELDCSGEVLSFFTVPGEDPEPYEFDTGFIADCDNLVEIEPPEPEIPCETWVQADRCCTGPAVQVPAWVNTNEGPVDPAQPWMGPRRNPSLGGTEDGLLLMTVEEHPDYPGLSFGGNSPPSAGGGIYEISPQGDAFWGSDSADKEWGFLLSAEMAKGCCGTVEEFGLWLNDIDGGEWVEFFPPAGATIVEENGAFDITTNPDGSVRYTGAGASGTNSNGALSITWPGSGLPTDFGVIVNTEAGGGVTPFTYATVRPPVEVWVPACDPTDPPMYVDPVTGLEIPSKGIECGPATCGDGHSVDEQPLLPSVEESVCFETTCTAAVSDGRYTTAPDTPDDLTGVSLSYELNGTETFLFEDPVTVYTWRDYLEGGRLAELIAANVNVPIEFSYEYLVDDGGNTEVRVVVKGCLPEGGESLGLSFASGDATTNFDSEEITVTGSGTALTDPNTGETVVVSAGSVVDGASVVPCPPCMTPTGVCLCYGDESGDSGSAEHVYTNDDNTTDLSASQNLTTIKWQIQLGQESDADSSGPFIADCINNGGTATIEWTTFDGVTSTFVADSIVADGTATGSWAFGGSSTASWSGKLVSARISCSETGSGSGGSGRACQWAGCDDNGTTTEEWRDYLTGEVLTAEQVATLRDCAPTGCVELCPVCEDSTVEAVVCASEEVPGEGEEFCTWQLTSTFTAAGVTRDVDVKGGVIELLTADLQSDVDSGTDGCFSNGGVAVVYGRFKSSITGAELPIVFSMNQVNWLSSDAIITYRVAVLDPCPAAVIPLPVQPTLAESYQAFVDQGADTTVGGVDGLAIERIECWELTTTTGENLVEIGDRILLVGTVDCDGNLQSSTGFNLDNGNMQVDPIPGTEACDPEPEVEEIRECIQDTAGVQWTQLIVINPDGSQSDPIFINAESLMIGTPAGEPKSWASCVMSDDTEIVERCFYDDGGTRYDGVEVFKFDEAGNYLESTYVVDGVSYTILPSWLRGPFDCDLCIQFAGCFDPRIVRFNSVTFADGTVIDLDALYGVSAATANDVMAEVQAVAGGSGATPTENSSPPSITCSGTNLHEFQFFGLADEIESIQSTIGPLAVQSVGLCAWAQVNTVCVATTTPVTAAAGTSGQLAAGARYTIFVTEPGFELDGVPIPCGTVLHVPDCCGCITETDIPFTAGGDTTILGETQRESTDSATVKLQEEGAEAVKSGKFLKKAETETETGSTKRTAVEVDSFAVAKRET